MYYNYCVHVLIWNISPKREELNYIVFGTKLVLSMLHTFGIIIIKNGKKTKYPREKNENTPEKKTKYPGKKITIMHYYAV